MREKETRIVARWAGLVAAVAALAAAAPGAAGAAETYTMKIGLATINDSQHEWSKRFVAAVEKDSGGRIKGEIYPASQLGSIPREIEGVQFGSIQIYVGPPEFMSGVDPRYEVLSAPGLVDDVAHGVRVVENPKIQEMMLSLGANKGLHGVALLIAQPSSVIARDPIRDIADFKGKKLRVLASQMQEDALSALGATPVAMTLGDVLPAIQQHAIDGALAAITIYTTMKYEDAAKYVTESRGLPFIFSLCIMSKKWYDSLPKDLQKIVDDDGANVAKMVDPWAADFYQSQHKAWTEGGGELISLPANEQASLKGTLAAVSAKVAEGKPDIREDYDTFAAVAKATR
jgi:TRAP-type C4-dicarboxylate transport system substrate-binding protein